MKKIAVINDLSGFGKCSLSVALPVISALGIEACPLPTAILSNQTGYSSFFCTDYTENMVSYIAEWKKMGAEFDGILTGYLASEKQVEIVSNFIEKFADDNTIVFVDPVMADDGVLYNTYDEQLCEKMKHLAKKANIISPNLTELCILCGADYEKISKENNIDEISALTHSLLSDNLKTVIVTGIKNQDKILNIIADKNGTSLIKSQLLGGSFSGTGDIFSSIVCGAVVNGKSVCEAVRLASDFIEKSIKNTQSNKDYEPDGVNFFSALEMLINAK